MPLRTIIDARALAEQKSYDGIVALGSFWTRGDNLDLQSRIVKCFKTPGVDALEVPGVGEITRAYAELVAGAAKRWSPEAVVRVLSSGETRVDEGRPHSLLATMVAQALGAAQASDVFFRTEPRKPMRMIDRFSGTDMLRQRIHYVTQDLFILPRKLPDTVLLIDDIFNLGATARVYAQALKSCCGVRWVYSANLAATRFDGGKDGWGTLKLDINLFLSIARTLNAGGFFEDAWTERATNVFHNRADCPRIEQSALRSIMLFATEDRVPCPSCAVLQEPRSAIRRLLENMQP